MTSEFKDLSQRLRETYKEVADDRAPSEDEVREAFATLAAAWSQVAGAVGTALQDEEVRKHLKHAGASFATAIGSTISDLGAELTREEE